MKLRMICVFLTVLLCVSASACSNGAAGLDVSGSNANGAEITASSSPSSEIIAESPAPTAAPTDKPSVGLTASEAIQAVLLDNAGFFSVDNMKELTLNDFLTNKELYEVEFQAARFAVLDLDGDAAPEVVLELTVNGNPEFYEVLHDQDGTVYGYLIVYRGMENLKADGTFLYSNGAADNGYGKLIFQSDGIETDTLGYTESNQNNGDTTISYFVGQQPVTEDAYQAFAAEQNGKEDATWYEFSQGNIEAELSVNP